jgi:hypothetical protein
LSDEGRRKLRFRRLRLVRGAELVVIGQMTGGWVEQGICQLPLSHQIVRQQELQHPVPQSVRGHTPVGPSKELKLCVVDQHLAAGQVVRRDHHILVDVPGIQRLAGSFFAFIRDEDAFGHGVRNLPDQVGPVHQTH